MKAPRTLTREQGYALTDTNKGARLSVIFLVTHQGLYRWSNAQEAWQLDRAERIVKASGPGGTFVWQRASGTFERWAA
jgi:hypothetical protein